MLMSSAKDYLSFYDYLPNGIIIYQLESKMAKLVYANQAALTIFGYTDMEHLNSYTGRDYTRMFCKEDRERLNGMIRSAKENQIQKQHHMQYRIETENGDVFPIDDYGHVVNMPAIGECVVCSLTRLDGEIFYTHEVSDKLTGLLAMGHFMRYCREILVQAEQDGDLNKYHIAYFNIRSFKDYNVEYGTKQGDKVLINLGRMLQLYSTTGVLSRFSADHFVALSKADHFVEHIQKVVDDFNLLYYSRGLSLKIGVYQITNVKEEVAIACDFAKAACDSIHDARESICMYDEELRKKRETSNYVVLHLDEAIQKKYIKVYYQPVVRTINESLVGMEALARWIDPVVGFLAPNDFIPVLEEKKLITKFDLYIFREICRQMREADEKGLQLIPVSFNLSRLDFLECDIVAEIEKIVAEYHIERSMLHVEITESMVIYNAEMIKRDIRRFQKLGYQVWMDDFGSGYSSLNVLQEYEFDEIKLDMAFMHKFDDKSKQIVKSVISMAKKIGVKTLVEGVETKEQFEFLRGIGCERVQGYYYSKPQPRQLLMDTINQKNIPVESKAWRRFYDGIGNVDFMTDRSLALVEYDGKEYAYLFMNQPYKDILYSIGCDEKQILCESINKRTVSFSGEFEAFQKSMVPGNEFEMLYYTINGYDMLLKAKCLEIHAEHRIYLYEIENLTRGDMKKEK